MSRGVEMGVIYKRGSKIPRSLHELNQTNNNQQYQSEPGDDFESEDDHIADFVEYLPPKRLRGKGITFTEDDADSDDLLAITSTTVSDNQPSQQIADKKIRMTTEIRQDLHKRLLIYGIRTEKTNVQIIESWIESHCPE